MYNEAVASLVKKEMIKSKSYNENFISNRNEKFNPNIRFLAYQHTRNNI